MSGQHFRAGVVIVVRHPDRRHVMAVERWDIRGAWQLPQGGLDEGEEPQQAAWRELNEEVGLGPRDVELVAEPPEWVAMEYPEDIRQRFASRRGQVHRWFLFDALRADPPVRCDDTELAAWRWVEPAWLLEQVAPFRRPAYERGLGTL